MSSRVFTAMFSAGECAAGCGDRIREGEEVRYNNDGELEHFSCTPDPRLQPGEPCPKCFLVHAGPCF